MKNYGVACRILLQTGLSARDFTRTHKQISSACLTRAPCQFNYAPQLSSTQWQIGSHGRSTGGSSAPQLSSTGRSAPMLSPFPSLLSCAWCVGAWHSGSNLECLGFSRSPKETDQVSVHCSNCCSVIHSSGAQIRTVQMHQRLASICGEGGITNYRRFLIKARRLPMK